MNKQAKRLMLIVAAVAALTAVGLVGAYLGERDTEDPSPQGSGGEFAEFTAGIVQTLDDCRWGEASCILALGIERALQSGNFDAVVSFATDQIFTCPGNAGGTTEGPFPLCEGAVANEGREGYPVARRFGDTAVVDQEGVREKIESFVNAVDPEASDSIGSGEMTLSGFGCAMRAFAFQNLSCARLAIIFTAILAGEQRRELLVFWAVGNFRGRTLPITEVWDGPVRESELPVLFMNGGELPDLGEVYVVDRSQ